MLLVTAFALIGAMAPTFAQTNVTKSSSATSSSNDTEKRFGFFGFPGFGGGFNPWIGGPPPGGFPAGINQGQGRQRPGPPHPEFFDESSLAGRPNQNQPGQGPNRPEFSGNPSWDRQDQRRPNWSGRPDQPTVFPSEEEDNRPLPPPGAFPGNFGGRPNNQNQPGFPGGQGVRPGNVNQGGRPSNQNQPGTFGGPGNFNQGGRPQNQAGNFGGPGIFNQGGGPNNQNQPGNFGGQGRPNGQNRPGQGNSQAQPWNSPINEDIRPVTEDTFETSPPSPLFIDQLQLTDPDTQQDPTNDFSEGFFRTTTRPPRQIRTSTASLTFPTAGSGWGGFTFPTSRFTSRPTRRPPTSTTTVSSLNLPEATTAVSPCELRCMTTLEFNPVCGTDNTSYQNPQKLKCAQRCGKTVTIQHYGNCIALPSSTTTDSSPRW